MVLNISFPSIRKKYIFFPALEFVNKTIRKYRNKYWFNNIFRRLTLHVHTKCDDDHSFAWCLEKIGPIQGVFDMWLDELGKI